MVRAVEAQIASPISPKGLRCQMRAAERHAWPYGGLALGWMEGDAPNYSRTSMR